MRRLTLSDKDWKKLQPLLPSDPDVGRPYEEHKPIIEGILWWIRTGVPWRDLPEEEFGSWQTVYRRFQRWTQEGRWAVILRKIRKLQHANDDLDWSAHSVDGTVVQAHPDAAGAPDSSDSKEALGISHGGHTTKAHLRLDRKGHLMGFVLTPGQDQEIPQFVQLMNQGKVSVGRGRPKSRPEAVVGDKGYNSQEVRDWLKRRGISQVIPKYKDQCQKGPFQKDLYRERNRIERRIRRFKDYRRIATRYEKRADHYEALWLIVEIAHSIQDIDANDVF